MVFWDYDTQWGADRSRSPGGAKDWGPLEFEYTERLLELHARYETPACFAVVGAAALPGERPYHDPAQVRRIHAQGHEVASHSMRHDWLPGLNAAQVTQTLRESKDALEQCLGAAVTAFVPPFNQPFDYWQKGAVSVAERREAGKDRTDLPGMCRALRETGYRFCRISYLPLAERGRALLLRRAPKAVSRPEVIAGVTCLRIHKKAGFTAKVIESLEQCVGQEGYFITYGHPHSLGSSGPQGEANLAPFLACLQDLQQKGKVEIVLPRQVI